MPCDNCVEKALEVLMISPQKGQGLIFPKVILLSVIYIMQFFLPRLWLCNKEKLEYNTQFHLWE